MSAFEIVVFPGQGSQRPGMSVDFAGKYAVAREVFERASTALGYDALELCRGTDTRLNLTEFAQPAILCAEIAILETLRAHQGLAALTFGGHSLGEYTALVAAGAISFESALKLVQKRGQLMQNAVAPGLGKMAALIREQNAGETERAHLPIELIREHAAREQIEIANENSHFQVVLSGLTAAVDRVCAEFAPWEADGRMRIVALATSAPFHSRHMKAVEVPLREAIEAISAELRPEEARRVVSNFTGVFHSGAKSDLIDTLVRQASGTVRWNQNMTALEKVSKSILEIGPDRPLRSFFLARGIEITAITDLRTLERAFRNTEAKSG